MSKNTTRLVTDNRLLQLLDCYGSESESWPENERQAALSLLNGSQELRHYQAEVRELDTLLNQLKAQDNQSINQLDTQQLQQRIMQHLHEFEPVSGSNIEELQITKHHSAIWRHKHRSRFWIGSIAASLFVVSLSVGVISQLINSTEHQQVNQLQSSNEFIQWAWEDVTGESLAEETENEPAILMALVDLDIPAE